eukprot:TRINITY_DN404_c3_g1_i1.p1 TRINITY_DN404_c3_g1~~TRINITY_DN404_c3_g1_i1.p1  ORF type:complete len:694 (+),score=186.97 TRINITY_DN404_c3_g1_i1:64-2082(+)
MANDDWPEPVGHGKVDCVLPAKGITREERLQHQIRILHEEFEEKMSTNASKLAELEESNTNLRKQLDLVNMKLRAEETECNRLTADATKASAAFEDLRRTSTEMETDFTDKIAFYREYIQRIDALSEKQLEEGDTADVPIAAAAGLRMEFDKKEIEMTVALLTKQNNKLKAELAGKDSTEENETAELLEHNTKLSEELEQLETHCMAQQQLRRDAQAEVTRLTSERAKLIEKMEKDSELKCIELENQLRDAVVRETSLQTELTASQRRGLTAQRQLDELRSSAQGETGPVVSNSSFNGQITAMQVSLDRAEAERESISKRLQETLTELNEERKKAREVREEAERNKAENDSLQYTNAEFSSLKERHETTETQLGNIKSLLDVKVGELASLRAKMAELEAGQNQLNVTQKLLNDAREQLGKATTEGERQRNETARTEKEMANLLKDLEAMQIKHEQETVQHLTVNTQLGITKAEKSSLETELHTTRAKLESIQEEMTRTNLDLTTKSAKMEEESLKQAGKLKEVENDSDWLQREVAKARRDTTKLDKEWRKKTKANLEEIEALKEQVQVMKQNLRKAKSESVGVPLPDHTSLSSSSVAELVRGGLDSWAKILSNLESFSSPTPTTEDECVFITALSTKVTAMLRMMRQNPAYPPLSAAADELMQRTTMVLNRF